MQSSGQKLRSSTSSNHIISSSVTTTASPSLDINGQAWVDSITSSGDQGASVSTNFDPTASRSTSAASDRSHSSYQHVSHRSRNSGGFLLPDLSSGLGYTSTKSTAPSPDAKGKGKVEDGDLIIPKRGLRSRHHPKPSLGGSPLAAEVLSDASAPGVANNHGIEGTQSSSAPSGGSRSLHSSHDSETVSSKPPGKNGGRRQAPVPALGFDTDPAQIVNLALSLSESRRRNLSGGVSAPPNGVNDRRIISGGSPSPGLHGINSGGSSRQQLQQQRRISRNISPRNGLSKLKDASPRLDPYASSPLSPMVPIPDFVQSPDLAFNPSDATLSRAEKARIAIELSYEYRRLLQYLPKLSMTHGRPTATRKGVKSSPEEPGDLGRPYNPIQYIRNRKVRIRERRPFDSEAEGWRDLERVRRWVDTVASEREAGIATVDDQYPLPRFEAVPAEPRIGDAILESSSTKPSPIQGNKQRRPRMDWIITPWDMLADAYWLQHDGNITHIEDCTGQKIISSPEEYKMPSARTSLDLDRVSHVRAGSVDKQAVSPAKIRSLIQDARNERSRERGRRAEQMNDIDLQKQNVESSQDRKGRWPRKLIRPRGSSSSSGSNLDELSRHKRGRRQNPDYLGSAVLEKHMMTLLAQEVVNGDDAITQIPHQSRNENDGPINTIMDGAMANSDLPPRPQASKEQNKNGNAKMLDHITAPASARSSLERSNRRHRATSFDDLDTTAPSSPYVPGFAPSIAINLSRPSSPQISPKKQLPSFRPARSKERQAISENDFALSSPSSTDLSRQATRDSKPEDVPRREKYKSEMNGFLSPTSEGFSKMFRRSDGVSKGSKESNEVDSRFRGFFRGGRLAEIVGNEVGRVGDRFWRKDASNQASGVASPASSQASDVSDSELDGLDSSPEANLSRTSTTNDSKPKYYTANLPSFQSSLVKDVQTEKPPTSTTEDHIQRQQLAQRQRGRSARFERLAPPKIDLRGVSPSPSPPLTRTQTRNIVPSYDPFDSRQSSTSRSVSRVRNADRRLNAVLGVPGTIGQGGPPMTGLAALESQKRRSRERPALGGKRQWSISDRSVSAVRGTVTKRDIARVRALLLSTGVKANEISRRAHEDCETSSPVLQDLREISGEPLPPVSRSQEHALAAKIYASHIEENNQQLRDAAEHFSSVTVDQLHQQIRDIDEHVTQKLTPMVRASADEADAFSAQLTTTHTLEVKRLYDAVDAILRRRRRRLRWVRRMCYVLLEWTLLGIMWWVWLIVVIVRLIRGTVGGFITAVRWLLWL